jgi:hypothetical protein
LGATVLISWVFRWEIRFSVGKIRFSVGKFAFSVGKIRFSKRFLTFSKGFLRFFEGFLGKSQGFPAFSQGKIVGSEGKNGFAKAKKCKKSRFLMFFEEKRLAGRLHAVSPPPPERKRMAKVKVGVKGLSRDQLADKGDAIKTAMTGNASFSTPNPPLTTIGTQVTALRTKIAAINTAKAALAMRLPTATPQPTRWPTRSRRKALTSKRRAGVIR